LRVLSRYRLTFDFRQGTVTFVPRAGIDAPFTPDRTGMSLTQDDPSAFIVLSVVPGSSSAQAGVRGGDHIVAVDGRSVPGAGLGLLDLRKYSLGTKPFALTMKSADGTQHVVTIHPRALVPPLY
jgi:C-terminal processing protease CtpA/Prc